MFHAGIVDGSGACFPLGQPIKNHATVQCCILKSNQHGDTGHFNMRHSSLLSYIQLNWQFKRSWCVVLAAEVMLCLISSAGKGLYRIPLHWLFTLYTILLYTSFYKGSYWVKKLNPIFKSMRKNKYHITDMLLNREFHCQSNGLFCKKS